MANRTYHVFNLKVIKCKTLYRCNMTLRCRAVAPLQIVSCGICIRCMSMSYDLCRLYSGTYHNTFSHLHTHKIPLNVFPFAFLFFLFIHFYRNQPHLNAQISQLSTKHLCYWAKEASIHKFTQEEFKVCCSHVIFTFQNGKSTMNSVPDVPAMARCRLYNMYHLKRGHTAISHYNCPGARQLQ